MEKTNLPYVCGTGSRWQETFGKEQFADLKPLPERSARNSSVEPVSATPQQGVPSTPLIAAAVAATTVGNGIDGGWSDEQVQRRVHSTIAEYFQVEDVEEVLACLKEIPRADPVAMAVEYCLNLYLETDDRQQQRRKTERLLKNFLNDADVLTPATFQQVLINVGEFLDDFLIDVPKGAVFYAQLLSLGLQMGTLDLEFLQTQKLILLQSSTKGDLLAYTLRHLIANKGEHWTRGMVQNTDLKAVIGFSVPQWEALLEKHQLNWRDDQPGDESTVSPSDDVLVYCYPLPSLFVCLPYSHPDLVSLLVRRLITSPEGLAFVDKLQVRAVCSPFLVYQSFR